MSGKLVQGPNGPVAVFDVDGERLAVDELCTHRGGPLSEGVVEDGCVRCPWHGSRFDLRTGAVATGPAKRAIRCYTESTLKLLFLLLVSCASLANASPWMASRTRDLVVDTFASLPAPGSREYVAFSEQIRRALEPGGAGWTTINLERWLPRAPFDALLAGFPDFAILPLAGNAYNDAGIFCRQYIQRELPERQLDPGELRVLRYPTFWVERLLQSAVSPHSLYPENTELRRGSSANGARLQWHIDGGDIAFSLALVGVGTERLPEMPHFQDLAEATAWMRARDGESGVVVPRAHLFVFSAVADPGFPRWAAPTPHRTPLTDADRLLLLGRYLRNREMR